MYVCMYKHIPVVGFWAALSADNFNALPSITIVYMNEHMYV